MTSSAERKSRKMPGLTIDDFEVLCTIGTGSYGTCKKIMRKKDNKMMVWKELDYGEMSDAEKQMLVSEVNLLRELKHPNIVRYYDRIIDRSRTRLYIIMEYCENGDLATLLSRSKKEGRHMDEEFVWKIAYQLTSALKMCHSRKKDGKAVLHRDLKPANVFLDNNMNIKLGDFGLARVLSSETSFAQTFVGTPYYMSPEQMNHMSYNEKSDIWSLGCMLYETCALRPPFTAYNQRDLATKINAGRFQRIPFRYSDELNTLITSMLVVNEIQRPSIDDLLKNPILLRKAGITDDTSSSSSGSKLDSQKVQQRQELLAAKENQLALKESQLMALESQLAKRERELQAQEEEVKIKEKLAEERIAKAERLIKEYQYKLKSRESAVSSPRQQATGSVDTTPTCLNSNRSQYSHELSAKKQVTFDILGKENFQISPSSEFDHVERIADLRRRLQAARLRSEELVNNASSHAVLAMR